MRVLWIIYAPLGKAGEVLTSNRGQSGTWINATADALEAQTQVDLGIAAIAPEAKKVKEGGVTYYGVHPIAKISGKVPVATDSTVWHQVIEDFEPEIIMLWGTEFSNVLSILDVAGDIPVVVFIQGVIKNIACHTSELSKTYRFAPWWDVPALGKQWLQNRTNKNSYAQSKIEEKIIDRCQGVIVDSQWASGVLRTPADKTPFYQLPLPVGNLFLHGKHDLSSCKRHTLFTIAGRYPGKGLFVLIEALAKVKRKYSDIKLYIPGDMTSRKPGVLFQSPYLGHLSRRIRELKLENNVEFCGSLDSQSMKDHLLSCNAFVMPSFVENHSASLREAMYLGVPCVTSLVGSVDEFTQYGENALTFRCGEVDSLAAEIIRVLEDDSLAARLGENAYTSVRARYPQDHIGTDLLAIYETVQKAHLGKE